MSVKPIEILYEDDAYVVVNKPSGLLVIPTPENETRTLTALMNEKYFLNQEGRLHPCHRLDRETSGVMVFAFGKKNQQLLMEKFKKRQVEKIYTAFVHGKLKKQQGAITSPVVHFEEKKHYAHPTEKWAKTLYQVTSILKDFSVVRIQLITGRTNQARIHFKKIGHPLVGERKYAFAKDYSLKFRRAALHAQKISFKHPLTNRVVSVTARLPDDMQALLSKAQKGHL